MSNVETQKLGLDFEIHYSSFDILRFKKLFNRLRLNSFEGQATVKPPAALPEDTFWSRRVLLVVVGVDVSS